MGTTLRAGQDARGVIKGASTRRDLLTKISGEVKSQVREQ